MKRDRSWRAQAAPLVAECVESGRALGLAGKKLWAYCNRSFPWGERQYHPYKIWRDEAKIQCGLKTRLMPGQAKTRPDLPGQARLFG